MDATQQTKVNSQLRGVSGAAWFRRKQDLRIRRTSADARAAASSKLHALTPRPSRSDRIDDDVL